jgi:hypothetical protein
MAEAASRAGDTTNPVTIPVIVDADTGFGEERGRHVPIDSSPPVRREGASSILSTRSGR